MRLQVEPLVEIIETTCLNLVQHRDLWFTRHLWCKAGRIGD